MAANVFGNPVTKLTLQAMVEYDPEDITAFETGHVAYHLKNAENKAVNARAYVDNLKLNYGTGVCTKCLIYNATGDAMTFIGTHDFHGGIGESPYPMQIENGQWTAFLHHKATAAATGSSGAVVYRIKGVEKGPDVDCMTAWSTSWGPWYSNNCYAEIRRKGYFSDTVWNIVETKMTDSAGIRYHFSDAVWGTVETKMATSGLQYVEENGFFRVEVTMGNDTTPEWEAVIKVGNRPPKPDPPKPDEHHDS